MEVEVRTPGDDGRSDAVDGAQRMLGRYRVVAELGRGSTSIVYLAAVDGRGGFNKLFALKQLRPALAEDPALVAMFLTEARIGAQLSHPNVVSTLEIEDGDALPFIVMEYLDGQPLQRVVTSARLAFTPLPLHMHLASLSEALEGLGHAHEARGADGVPLGIVHRDVSPHNVFVTASGTTKLLDFGFAQTADSPNTMLSSAGRVAYMSPEQAARGLVDARSDLFSVGVMMWEAVTRRRFWSEEASKMEIVRALSAGELPPSRLSALASAPESLRSIIVRATAPDAGDRYESASAFQGDLRAALREITPPTFDRRDLGKRVVTIFASERARLQAAINGQRESNSLPPPSAPPSSVPPASAPPSSGPPSSALPRSVLPPPVALPRILPPPGIPAASAAPASPSPVEDPLEAAPDSARAARLRNTTPLPSFPIPAPERAPWRPRFQDVAIGVIALAALAGVGLSALQRRADEPASAPTKASPAFSAATIVPSAEAPIASPIPAAAPVPAAEASEETRLPTPPVPARPPPSLVAALPSRPVVAPPRAALAVVASAPESAVPVAESHPPAGHPSRPIDALNPYAP